VWIKSSLITDSIQALFKDRAESPVFIKSGALKAARLQVDFSARNSGEGVSMHLGKLARVTLLLTGLFLSMSSLIDAQVNTVNLSGSVFDPQHLAVKDAKITLRNTANGAERAATSDSNGRYEIIGIPPGTYSLTVEAQGFAVLKDESLTLALGTTPEYNPQLQLRTTSETISVVAAPASLKRRRLMYPLRLARSRSTIYRSTAATTSISRC
jgi:hypothetical protein